MLVFKVFLDLGFHTCSQKGQTDRRLSESWSFENVLFSKVWMKKLTFLCKLYSTLNLINQTFPKFLHS